MKLRTMCALLASTLTLAAVTACATTDDQTIPVAETMPTVTTTSEPTAVEESPFIPPEGERGPTLPYQDAAGGWAASFGNEYDKGECIFAGIGPDDPLWPDAVQTPDNWKTDWTYYTPTRGVMGRAYTPTGAMPEAVAELVELWQSEGLIIRESRLTDSESWESSKTDNIHGYTEEGWRVSADVNYPIDGLIAVMIAPTPDTPCF